MINSFQAELKRITILREELFITDTGMDPKQAIYHRKVDSIDTSTLQMIQMYNSEAESLSGVKSFSAGIGSQAFGSVAQGIRSAMDAVSKREISVLRRISEDLFADIGRKTIAMNQAYIDEAEIIRVTKLRVYSIKREDITGEFDLICDVSTAEKDNETAQDLAMVLQTNAATMSPEISKMIWAKILKLKTTRFSTTNIKLSTSARSSY